MVTYEDLERTVAVARGALNALAETASPGDVEAVFKLVDWLDENPLTTNPNTGATWPGALYFEAPGLRAE